MLRSLMPAAVVGLVIAVGAPSAFAQHRHLPELPPSKEVTIHGTDVQTGKETRSMPLKYHESDVSTPERAQALLRRIRTASRHLCGPGPKARRTLRDTADFNRCVHESMQEAVQGINAPLLDDAFKAST